MVVQLPGATPTVPDGYTWKLYRTYTGDFTDSLLMWVVEETSEGSGIITTEFIDLGLATGAGTPKTTAPTFTAPEKIELTDGFEVTGVLAPANMTFSDTLRYEQSGALAVVNGEFAWECPYERAYVRGVLASLGRDGSGVSSPTGSSVIVDVEYWADVATPSWVTIFTNQATRPTILVGASTSGIAVPQIQQLVLGDKLVINIEQVDSAADAENLLVQILLWVYDSTATSIDVFG